MLVLSTLLIESNGKHVQDTCCERGSLYKSVHTKDGSRAHVPLKDMRDEMVNGEISRQVLFNQLGHVCAALVAAKGRALPRPPRDKLKGTRLNLVT
jgi:hypothetical protein